MPTKKKKYNSRFPPARIKKIMQMDEDVGKVAAPVPVIISRALELFVETLLKKVNDVTQDRGARTVTPSHIKRCIHSEARFDFLKELVVDVPDLQGDRDDQGSIPSSSSSSSSSTSLPLPPPPSTSSTSNQSGHQSSRSSRGRPKRLSRKISHEGSSGNSRSSSSSSSNNKPKSNNLNKQQSSGSNNDDDVFVNGGNLSDLDPMSEEEEEGSSSSGTTPPPQPPPESITRSVSITSSSQSLLPTPTTPVPAFTLTFPASFVGGDSAMATPPPSATIAPPNNGKFTVSSILEDKHSEPPPPSSKTPQFSLTSVDEDYDC